MNKNRQAIRAKYGPLMAAACVFLALAAHAGPPLRMQPHWLEVPGIKDLEAGNYARAVERLEARLATGRKSPAHLAPVLIDLCIGYTMLNRIDEAMQACDRAVETGRYTALAHNNRGVVNMVRGHYTAAIADFAVASRGVNSSRLARTNRNNAQYLLAAIGRQREYAMFARNMDVNDVSVATVREVRDARRLR